MKDKRHIKSFNEVIENLNISDVSNRCIEFGKWLNYNFRKVSSNNSWINDKYGLLTTEKAYEWFCNENGY